MYTMYYGILTKLMVFSKELTKTNYLLKKPVIYLEHVVKNLDTIQQNSGSGSPTQDRTSRGTVSLGISVRYKQNT
jgi:hypothetical protein